MDHKDMLCESVEWIRLAHVDVVVGPQRPYKLVQFLSSYITSTIEWSSSYSSAIFWTNI
jgi:hypothetical protein